MTSLKLFALNFKGQKDITDLDKISTESEIGESEFEKNGKKLKYNFIEIDGWKYTLKAPVVEAIKQILAARPTTKFIKVNKTPSGEYFVIPLD
jgi:hypothetical protein